MIYTLIVPEGKKIFVVQFVTLSLFASLGSKPPPLTQIAQTGLGTRLEFVLLDDQVPSGFKDCLLSHFERLRTFFGVLLVF